MRSMTGFGSGTRSDRGFRCRVDCSSVNRKQGEVVVQLSREYASLDALVRSEVVRESPRGRVSVTVVIERIAETGIDAAAARQAYAQLLALKKNLGLPGDVELRDLLALPGVLRDAERHPSPSSVWPLVRDALADALQQLKRMRDVEGKNLARAMKVQLRNLKRVAASIRKQAPAAVNAYRAKLAQRIRRADIPIDLSDERLLKEVAFLAERSDVEEELTRLQSHLGQLESLLSGDEPIGRTLEFLVQEIFREFNTIGAKSSSATITSLVVQAKTELDRLREQSANVE